MKRSLTAAALMGATTVKGVEKLQGDHGLRFGAAALTHGTHFFGRLELHRNAVDLQAESLGQPLANRLAVVLQLGRFQNYGGIHVDDAVAALPGQIVGVAQKDEAVRSLPARVGIGEVHADIAQRGRPQDGVGDGVGQHIGVGMALEPELAGDRDAAQNHGTAGGDAVHVPAQAGPNLAQERAPRDSSRRNRCASSISLGLVILILRSLPGTTLTSTIAEALASLTNSHPQLRNHLFTGEGKLRTFVNLYMKDQDVPYLTAKEATSVTATDTLSITPSIAGGC